MPHVIVKLYPGPSEEQKTRLAQQICAAVMSTLHLGDESVSVSMEEVGPSQWMKKVYGPDIADGKGRLYKNPGYGPLA